MFLNSSRPNTLFALVSCSYETSEQVDEVRGFEESCLRAQTLALELGTDVVVHQILKGGELGPSEACFLG